MIALGAIEGETMYDARGVTPRIFTLEDIAEILKIRPKDVRKLIRKGDLKGKEILPKVWRVQEEDLTAFVNEGRKP